MQNRPICNFSLKIDDPHCFVKNTHASYLAYVVTTPATSETKLIGCIMLLAGLVPIPFNILVALALIRLG